MVSPSRDVSISNLQDIEQYLHKCTSQPILTEIQVTLARNGEQMNHLSECFVELGNNLEEQNKSLNNFINTFDARLRNIEITSGTHKCWQKEPMEQFDARLREVESVISQYKGGDKWVSHLFQIIEGVTIALAVLVIAYIMKGGTIT